MDKNVIATEIEERQLTNEKARFSAYIQGMNKLGHKAQMQNEDKSKGETKA